MRDGQRSAALEAAVMQQRIPRSYDAKEMSELTAYQNDPEDVVLVQQQFADEVDINVIMRRFGVTGSLPFGPATGIYGDFTGIFDYDDAVERIEGARRKFMEMPPEIREKFDNDPGKLIAAAERMPAAEFDAMFVTPPPPVAEGN